MPVIDRFEGDFALWEGGCAPRSKLPAEAREGDAIEPDGEGGYLLAPQEDIEVRKAALAARLAALFKRNPEHE